jgi:hypothetical protein
VGDLISSDLGVGIVGARNDRGRLLTGEGQVLIVLQYPKDRGKFQRGSTTHEQGREPGGRLYDAWTAGAGKFGGNEDRINTATAEAEQSKPAAL